MHLVGISVWVGGLIALYAVFAGGSKRTEVLVGRYSTLALGLRLLHGWGIGPDLGVYSALQTGGYPWSLWPAADRQGPAAWFCWESSALAIDLAQSQK